MTGSSRALHRIVYFSRQTKAVAADLDHEVGNIIAKSIHNNRIDDVTGLLITLRGWFVQALEGPSEPVRITYGRILNDPRHSDVTIIDAGPAERRLFADWNMCARAVTAADQEIIDTLESRGPFEPHRLNASSGLKLLTTIAAIQRRTAALAHTS